MALVPIGLRLYNTAMTTTPCPPTCATDCVVCEEHAESLDKRGICVTCSPDALQCACCGGWFDKSLIRREPGVSPCGHQVCEGCQSGASRNRWTDVAECAACEEEQ